MLMLYFALLSMAPNWQGVQLLNASAFLEHYQDYQAKSNEGTIFTFIQEHYFNKVQDFDKEHEKLPFKSTVQVAAVYFTEKFEVPTPVVQMNEELMIGGNRNNGKLDAFISNDFHSIWQPPQLG